MRKLDYPFKKEDILELKVGDMVLISGKLYTGRDVLCVIIILIEKRVNI